MANLIKSAVLYRTMYHLHEKGITHCQWIAEVKSILNNHKLLDVTKCE